MLKIRTLNNKANAMTIWAKLQTKEQLNKMLKEIPTLMQHLEMEVVEITSDSLSIKMPVDNRTKQIHGILHGGASAALAETVGSIASYLSLEEPKASVGLELNISHLKAVHSGSILAVAKPVRLGKSIQVWEIRNFDEAGNQIALARLTMMVLNKPLAPI